MKVVLFCGGLGTRIRDYSEQVPKPMIPVGGEPILRHIMQYYSNYGHRDFVLCTGYKADVIRGYFLNSALENGGRINAIEKGLVIATTKSEGADWRVTMIDTGLDLNVGQRLMAVRHLVQDEEYFLANYGDGLSDVHLPGVIEHFKKSGKIACFVAVRPPFNFHLADIDDAGDVQRLIASHESQIWINGGYFVFRREIFDYIRQGEELVLEPFNRLIAEHQLLAHKYEGFWRPMDTLRDKQVLEDMVARNDMPWRNSARPMSATAQ